MNVMIVFSAETLNFNITTNSFFRQKQKQSVSLIKKSVVPDMV